MSDETSSSASGIAGFLLILGLPVCLAGIVALMVFISIGHQREDPGPGQAPKEEEEAAAPADPTPAGVDPEA